MDLPEQKATINNLSLGDLRQLGRDKRAELVATGLLEADRADEIESEETQRKAEDQEFSNHQHSLSQNKIEDEKKDKDWLHEMSQSYQQAYHQLMNSYDEAEGKYDDIKSRAEKLKDDLREKKDTAYQFGMTLPDGEYAFYDRKNNTFVDGATLQPLKGDDAKAAADEFKLLVPKQQNQNAHYVDACRDYADADDISQTADAKNLQIQNDKQTLESSQGDISENDMKRSSKVVSAEADGLSKRLANTEDEAANLDAAMSADGDDANAPQNTTTQTTSFASQIDTNAKPIGAGNGKTSVIFNAAVQQTDAGNPTIAAPAVIPVSPPASDYNRVQGFSK